LEEIIAETFNVGTASKKVLAEYENMVQHEPEFKILLDLTEDELKTITTPQITESILRVRRGQVHIEPGYDGVFGKIHIYDDKERLAILQKPDQSTLF
jgi:PHP family Zn ribbon phosphoesterase